MAIGADWKKIIRDQDFQRFPVLEKAGTVKVKFLNEGKFVSKNVTGYTKDSVVFLVESEGKKELWFSVFNPVLSKLAKLGNIEGKELTLKFSGSGTDMICEVEEK